MPGSDERADLLQAVPLFAACSKRQLKRIAAIADELRFQEGKALTRQGDPGRELFILLEGIVSVERNGVEVNRLGPGDFVGEGALVLRKPRNATSMTRTPVRALVITETNFKRLLREDAGISMNVLETLAERTPPDE